MTSHPAAAPVLIGEVLFDVFPDGQEVLGGAPFNVAWNLQGLGIAPRFVSRVGRDARGQAILDHMAAWEMPVTAVQQDPDHPTGVVQVTLAAGQPSYDIVRHSAWDFVDAAEATSASGGTATWLYHGTLAARSAPTREAIRALRSLLGAAVFVDLNLRAPWWTPAIVEDALRGAAVAKLNDEEISEIEGGVDPADESALIAAAGRLLDRFGIRVAIVTRGERGALAVNGDGAVATCAAGVAATVVDPVGAGDAFAAVSLIGLMRNWPLETILERAADFAAGVVGRRGATTTDPAPYDSAVRSWGAGYAV